MNSRKIILGLALVGVLGLVLWQLNRARPTGTRQPAPVTQSPAAISPAARAPSPATIAQQDSPPTPSATPPSVVQSSSPSVLQPDPVAPTASAALTFTPPAHSPEQQAGEEAATARMYAAHAPLRTPEVADPDSRANKLILGTMVAKALLQPASPPPSAVASAHP